MNEALKGSFIMIGRIGILSLSGMILHTNFSMNARLYLLYLIERVLLPCFLFTHLVLTFEDPFFLQWLYSLMLCGMAMVIGCAIGFLISLCFRYSSLRQRGPILAYLSIPDIGGIQFALIASAADFIDSLASNS